MDFIRNGNPAIGPIAGERVLEGIHDKFGDNQAETLGLTGRRITSLANHFQRDRSRITNHRRRERIA